MPNALVAEDNIALARVITFTLSKAGFEVTQTAHGAQAWEAAQQRSYDLVITDQQMPEMNGLELCERLRQREEYHQTPIVLLTAKGMELDSERISETLGVSCMLLKPFSPSELARVACELTQSHAM